MNTINSNNHSDEPTIEQIAVSIDASTIPTPVIDPATTSSIDASTIPTEPAIDPNAKYMDKRVHSLPNMDNTRWFKTMGIYPVNNQEMDYFIKTIDLLNICKKIGMDKVMERIALLSPLGLDLMFVVLKQINLFIVRHCEVMIHKYIEVNIGELIFKTIILTSEYKVEDSINAFLDEVYTDSSHILVNNFNYCRYNNLFVEETPSKNTLSSITKKMIHFYCTLFGQDYYVGLTDIFDITLNNKFFNKNIVRLNDTNMHIYKYMRQHMVDIVQTLENILKKILDNDSACDDLHVELDACIDIENVITSNCDMITHFNDLIVNMKADINFDDLVPLKIYEYANFLYDEKYRSGYKAVLAKLEETYCEPGYDGDDDAVTELGDDFSWYNEDINDLYDSYGDIDNLNDFDVEAWNKQNEEKMAAKAKEAHDTAVNNASNLGYQLYPDKAIKDVLIPFVLYKLVVDTTELINLLVTTMEGSRAEIGIFDKYCEIDLESAYMYLAISNDVNKSYDDFISFMKLHNRLPFDCSIEFILRLVSRVCNVDIHFYDDKMACTIFDNTIYKMYSAPVIIYNYDAWVYYILHPKDIVFGPLVINSNNTPAATTQAPRKKKVKKMKVYEI